MKQQHTFFFTLITLGSLFSVGCVGDDSIVEPNFGEKGDGFSAVVDGGEIGFTKHVSGEFTEDFQFVSYWFRAREAAAISLSIDGASLSPNLRPTLFLYRSPEGETPTRIELGDEPMPDPFDVIQIPTADRYLIVVGTRGANGRGTFDLAMRCGQADCGPEPVGACTIVRNYSSGTVETIEYDEHGRLMAIDRADGTTFTWKGFASVKVESSFSTSEMTFFDRRLVREERQIRTNDTLLRFEHLYEGDQREAIERFENDQPDGRFTFVYLDDGRLETIEGPSEFDDDVVLEYSDGGGISSVTSNGTRTDFVVDDENRPVSTSTLLSDETLTSTFAYDDGLGCTLIARGWQVGQPNAYDPWEFGHVRTASP